MEFSQAQMQQLQQTAGLLGVTVDQLISLRRTSTVSSGQLTYGGDGCTDSLFPSFSQSFDAGQRELESANLWHASRDHDYQTLDGFSLGLPFVPPTVPDSTQEAETLPPNPQTAWFECNNDFPEWFSDLHTDALTIEPPSSLNGSEGLDYVQLTPAGSQSHADWIAKLSVGADAESERAKDIGAEWAIVSSSTVSRGFDSPSTAPSLAPRYPNISPKPAMPGSNCYLREVETPGKVRKKRGAYSASKRSDAALNRQINACLRCRVQRNSCVPDATNPRGPCVPCQEKKTRMSRLPCLRYKISDSTLFRTGLEYMPFYKAHPMIGPQYGDFHIVKQWIKRPPKLLYLGQDLDASFQLELREFVPPDNPHAVDVKGRPMYAVSWAIQDPDLAVACINAYVDNAIELYWPQYLDRSDSIIWDVFIATQRACVYPRPNELLQNVLRLWTVCRFIEGKWRCWGEDDTITANNPKNPFHDWQSLPPYMDYQFASIIIQRILCPLRQRVLHDFQSIVSNHRQRDWFVTFLTSFILLHNYELQMRFQFDFAARRRSPYRYMDMSLVRATNSGAKTILAHFHYCCNGQRLFTPEFDWKSAKVRRMAHLDEVQSEFMANYRDLVARHASGFRELNHTDLYHEKYWYTSQLFDPEWEPRETLEHSPRADRQV